MSTLVSIATGNFTTNTTWGVSDATAELDSEAGNNVVDTTNRDSAAHLEHEAGIYAGICLKIQNRAASPAGTLKVVLLNSSDNLEVASVTVNVADLPYWGWVFFKFGSPFTTTNGKNYKVRCVCSNSGSQVTLYTNNTGYNWSKFIVSTTNAVPAAGDKLMILGNITAAGTWNAVTVTMDSVASTNSYGPTVAGGPPWGIGICKNGTLAFGYAASTTYKLKWKGVMYVSEGGTLTVGTVGNPIPSTSTAELIMDAVAAGDTGIVVGGGNFQAYGAAKKSWCLLTADAAAGQKVVTCEDTTGWAAGDSLFLPATVYSAASFDESVIGTVDSGTQVTVNANLSYLHHGAAGSVCPGAVGNLTRNVKLYSVNSSYSGYVNFVKTQTVDGTASLYYTEFQYLGSNNSGKYGVNLNGTAGAVTIYHSVFKNGYVLGIQSGGALFDARYNVCYSFGYAGFWTATSSASGWKFRDNLVGRLTASWNYGVYLQHMGGTIAGNRIYSIGTSYSAPWGNDSAGGADVFVCEDNWICTSNQAMTVTGTGIGQTNIVTYTRCHNRHCGTGFNGGASITGLVRVVDSDVIGCPGATDFTNSGAWRNIEFIRCQFAGSALNAMSKLAGHDGGTAGRMYFEDCIWGANGVTNFVDPTGSATSFGNVPSGMRVELTNCKFVAGKVPFVYTGQNTNYYQIDGLAIMNWTDWDLLIPHVVLERHDQTAGAHRSIWGQRGVLEPDTVIYNTASPSERVYPKTFLATGLWSKMWSSRKAIPVASGTAITVRVWVRKSKASDAGGYDYAGAQPRLMCRRNHAMGYDVETVCATMTAAVGNWEQLTVTTGAAPRDTVLEFYIDCDGKAGWVNVDDWTVS